MTEHDGVEGAAFGRRERWAVSVALMLAVATAFSPVLGNGFIGSFDDSLYVTRNPWVRQGLTWEGIRWALAAEGASRSYWHPLTWLSLMVNVETSGLRPGPIHATNLLLHALSAILLFLALEKMTGRPWKSAAVALLFAVHPLQVEAVAWAAERKTVLAGALGMGALLAYARYVERPGARRYLTTLGLFLASLLAKPVFVTLPALLLLLDVWPLGRTGSAEPVAGSGRSRAPLRRLVVEKIPLLAAGGAVTAVIAGLTRDLSNVPTGLRVAAAFTAYWRYVEKIAWPSALSIFYPQAAQIAAWHAVLGAAGLVAVTAALALARRRVGLGPLVGWLWFVGTMVPFAGLVRNGLWPHIADRFVYLPIAGLLLTVVWAAGELRPGPSGARIAGAVLALAVAALGARTWVRARLWGDEVALFETSARATIDNRVAWANLGAALMASGRHAEAKAALREMIELMPGIPDGHVNYGLVLAREGDLSGAEAAFRAAIQADPKCAQAHFNLGLVLKVRGDRDGSIASMERAVADGLREGYPYMELGLAYVMAGRTADAERAFRESLGADQLEWKSGMHLGRLLVSEGRLPEARRVLLDARRRAALGGEDASPVEVLLARYAGTER